MKTLQKTLSGLLILTLFVPNIALFAQVSDSAPESSLSSPSETTQSTDTSISQINNDSGISVEESIPKTEESLAATDSTSADNQVVNEGDIKPEEKTAQITNSQYTLIPGTRVPELTYKQNIDSKVDTFSGALVQSVPIQIPGGRNGLQPNISLDYNNQNQDTFSKVGFGWNASIPSIERVNKTGIEKLYTDNYFSSSLSGELASTTDTTIFKTKNENGDFLKYSFVANVWTVVDKKGTTYTFGATEVSRQFSASSTASTTKWMLSEVRDSNNNFYRYEYVKDGNEIYPSKVLYTGNGTQDGIYTVEFVLENRPDTYVSYKNGYKVEIKKRIKEILVKVSGVERGKYVLGYVSGTNGTRSLLASVTESRISESGSLTTMSATTFQYTNDPVTYVRRDENANSATRDGYFQSGRIAIDFDGNGLNEKLASYSMDYNNGVTTGAMSDQALNLGDWQVQRLHTVVPAPWTTGPNGFPEEFFDYGTRVFDVNGDLLPDLVKVREPRLEDSSVPGLFLNTGDLSFATTTGNAQIPTFRYFYYTGASTAYVNSALLANVNGDQLVDTYSQSTQCQLTAIPGPAQHYCGLPGSYIGIGSGWVMNPRNLFSGQLVHGAEIPDTIIFADVNNDGLDDQIKQQGASTTAVYLNLGNNTWLATSSTWSIPHPLQEIGAWPKYDQGVRVFDINGDGLLDIIRSYYVNIPSNTSNMSSIYTGRYMPFPTQGDYKVVYLNTGSGWVLTSGIFVFGVVDNAEISNYNWRGSFLINDSYFDANGDGLTDFGNNIRQGRKPDMLIKTTYGTGAVVDVEYKPTPQHVKPRGTTGFYDQTHSKLPSVIYTVTKLTKSVVGQPSQITEYAYEGGKNDFRGPNTLKFAGFKKVTETKGDTKTTSYFHQGDDSDVALGEQNDEYAKIGKVFREDITNANGNLYKRNWYKWDAVNRSNGAWYAYLTDSVEQVYDGNTSHKDKALTNVYDTANGNLLTSTDWGEVQGGDTASFTDIGNDKQVTTIAYATNVALNHFAPKEITKVNASGVLIEKVKLYYDNAPHGTLTKGNNTKVEQYKDATTFVTTTKSFNSFGLVATEQDANENSTTYKYDQYNLFPVSILNALNQEVVYTYDYTSAKPLSVITPDGAAYSYIYDGFGRMLEEWVPYKGGDSMLKTSFEYTNTPNNVSVKKSDYVDEGNSIDTYSYFDGLNRPTQTKREAENENWVTTDTVYDAQGRTLKQSLPYFTQTESKSAVTTNNNLFTSFTYDVQDRVLTQTNSVGVTRYEYDDWKKTVTDALSRNKYFYNDAFGNLVKVTESTGLIDYNTLYEYNGQNKLTKITDANSNVRNFTYDLLGRQLTAEDIHAPSDTNFATYTYLYDNAGNLTQKTTPGGVVVSYTHDALNRVLTEDAPVKNQERIEYVYDSCEYGFGKVCEVKKVAVQPFFACDILGCASTVTPVTTKTFDYTGPGLVAREVSTIAGETYATQYTYDRQGNKISITNPDNAVTIYTYNSAGLLENIQYYKDGETKAIVSSIDYAPTGAPTLQVNGNGTQTCNTYDGNKLYRLTNKKTVGVGSVCVMNTPSQVAAVPGVQATSTPGQFASTTVITLSQPLNLQSIQNLDYTYDVVGNIRFIQDVSSSTNLATTEYIYDPLNRLLSATNASSTESFTYDGTGNILTRNGVPYLYETPNKTNPHAVTKVGNIALTYDANGNALTIGEQINPTTNVWNYKNELTQTSRGGVTVDYLYDESGTRVFKKTGSKETSYPSPYFFQTNTGTTTTLVMAGNDNIATIEDGRVLWNHTDHLGSTIATTNSLGSIIETTDYSAFGHQKSRSTYQNTQQTEKYTGHTYDPESDMLYAQARYYRGSLGRFLSQDPVYWNGVGEARFLTDPQAQNSYSYARNNPIRYLDPNGEWYKEFLMGQQSFPSFQNEVGEATQYMGSGWQTAMDHPVAAGALTGVGAGVAAYGGAAAINQVGIGVRLGRLDSLPINPRNFNVPQKGFDAINKATGLNSTQATNLVRDLGKSFTDLRPGNVGNINTWGKVGENVVRFTTEPTATRIISTGVNSTQSMQSMVNRGVVQVVPFLTRAAQSVSRVVNSFFRR